MGKETTLHDDVKQALWQKIVDKEITDQFKGAELPEIEKQLTRMYKKAQEEQEKQIKKFMAAAKTRRYKYDENCNTIADGKEEFFEAFADERRKLLAADYESLMDLFSMLKSGTEFSVASVEKWLAHHGTRSKLLFDKKSVTVKGKTVEKYIVTESVKEENRIARSSPRVNDDATETETQIHKIYDEIWYKVHFHKSYIRNTGNEAKFDEQAARPLWDAEVQDYLKNSEIEEIHNDTPKNVGNYRDRILQNAELRLRTLLKDIYAGRVASLSNVHVDKTTKPKDLATRLAKSAFLYTFLTPEERCEFYYKAHNRSDEARSMDYAKGSVDQMLANQGKLCVAYPSLSHPDHYNAELLKIIEAHSDDYDKIELSEENYKDRNPQAFEQRRAELFKATENNGKAELEALKTNIRQMKQQFNSLYSVVKDIRGTQFSRTDMLSTLMSTLAQQRGVKDPSKVQDEVMNMADSVKRTFWQRVFFKNKNKYSTELRELVTKFAKKTHGEIDGDDLDRIRLAAENLKFSIDKGKEMSDKELQNLSDLDRKRYSLAVNVMNSMFKSIEREKNAVNVREGNERGVS